MSESGSEHPQKAKPSRSHLLLAATVVVALGIVLIFVLSKQDETKQDNAKYAQDVVEQQPQYTEHINTAQTKPVVQEPAEAPETVEIPASANRNEIPIEVAPATPSEPELPSLDNSDEVVKQTVAEIMTEKALALIVSDDMVRRGVVFVENLAKGQIAEKHMPVKKPQEPFMALEDDIVITDPNSFERYTPYVDMLSSMSTAQIVRMLNKFQPLIAQAYEEIGYDGNDFNGTLDKAISELLSTPIPKNNVPLIKDSVTYRYAYPEWEQLSEAQKQFLRMGPENMERVKQRLSALQKSLAQ
ncbi:hypothetical protein PSECIP111854_03388 [Pseudoalteromonas sp. CIP111854]|uniref:DUF3014 domain-containing protein n=1 Tax=Pseudoalteromonas holothuriae TaxID=2963714 RepID=A0A9W4W2A3_9GAMM|nr:DUF3014 domain-containing protein [Pseudoalteromonas sp. CIP111854]CAH9064193.1 hypothetical protein PSECIP111854_03388 [Pseudoalteromonas sp. CIP111854]